MTNWYLSVGDGEDSDGSADIGDKQGDNEDGDENSVMNKAVQDPDLYEIYRGLPRLAYVSSFIYNINH